VTIKERTANNDGSIEDSSEANKTSKLPRDLVFNFWALSPSQRRKIMQRLDLLEPDDDQLPETQRYRLAFERAEKREMINSIEKLVNQILAK